MRDTQTFLNVLDPEETSTGGGSASAIAGGMAGALLSMVCLISARTDQPGGTAVLDAAALRARELSDQLLLGGEVDALAFQALRKGFRLPRGNQAERTARSQVIQAAWVQAARVPLENATLCMELLKLAASLTAQVKEQVRSDYYCSIHLAKAGLLGCLENVATNLPSIQEQTIVEDLARRSLQLRQALQVLELPARLSSPSDNSD